MMQDDSIEKVEKKNIIKIILINLFGTKVRFTEN